MKAKDRILYHDYVLAEAKKMKDMVDPVMYADFLGFLVKKLKEELSTYVRENRLNICPCGNINTEEGFCVFCDTMQLKD